MRIRYVDEDPRSGLLELKRFRMSRQRDLPQFLSRFGIDKGEGALAETDHEPMGAGIEPDVVRVVAELQPAERREIGAAEAVEIAVAAVGNVDRIGFRNIRDTLRFVEA